MSFWKPLLLSGLASAAVLQRSDSDQHDGKLDDCPGYTASNVQTTDNGLTADLKLAGPACNAYGDDLEDLQLSVTYESEGRIHVKIQDQGNQVYQVPEDVLPRPGGGVSEDVSHLKFDYTEEPFSFSVLRAETDEVLFDTSAASLVFESQYLRLRTGLPEDPYLYGLGEHTDNFRLNTTDYTRTLYNRDSYAVPPGTNLYGSHPIYLEQRETGSHGVFFLNSNGMDVFIDSSDEDGQYLEYNVLGGVLDFYFLAGPEPVDVVKQYNEVIGLPAMQPYWGLGFHQCRYGYQDVFEVAEVVYNYSQANIPLETMWTDIDYMDQRAIFTLDSDRYPLELVRQLVDYLHERQQHYIVMVDPAVAVRGESEPGFETLERGRDADIYLKRENGSDYIGVVWPGATVYPDWFADNVTDFWNFEFDLFFDADTGVDIDGLWIDMNEPANMCEYLCEDPFGDAIDQDVPPAPPPVREWPRPLPGFPCEFQPEGTDCEGDNSTSVSLLKARSDAKLRSRAGLSPAQLLQRHNVLEARQNDTQGDQKGLPGRDLLHPQYAIHNEAVNDVADGTEYSGGALSSKTVNTDVVHANDLVMYDTHNLYGAMMGAASRSAMLNRRSGLRPFIITRSSFPGDGRNVGHWLGDNVASWEQYRFAIHTTMTFSALYGFPMAGSDVCGFDSDTTEQLCARWAALGAFNTFYRNHNGFEWKGQEFYRWPSVAESARRAIDIRYRLLDYIYTALYRASEDGAPVLNPVFYLYPEDRDTWALQYQFFYGQGVLVAPVLEEDATSVSVYLPEDTFYDWYTHEPVCGSGAEHTFDDVEVEHIPLLIRGGVILPLRADSANTTAALRENDFELVIPVGADGTARGELYLDDGVSIEQPGGHSLIEFVFEDGELTIDGLFGYETDVRIAKIKILDGGCGGNGTSSTSSAEGAKTLDVGISLNEASTTTV